MATLRVLIPDATENYIKNPSARFDATDMNVFGATVTRSLDYARHGISSYKAVTAGAALREGIFYRVSDLQGINDTITVSAYVRGNGYVRIRLIDNSLTSGAEWYSKPVRINLNKWQRIEVSGRCSGSNDVRLYVETDGKAEQAITFYVDSLQMERHPYATTYADGDQPGCRWNIIQHASHSTRDKYTRLGGRWVELAGKDQAEKDLYMTVIGGLGMAPVQNQVQPFATAPGSFFQGVKVDSRVVTFTFNAKHKNLSIQRKQASLSFLHQLRQLLIDVVKPDRTGGNEPFLMEYADGATPLYFWARYDGGLEGEWDIRNQWVNAFPLRILVVSPMLTEDDQELFDVDFQESLVIGNIVGRVDGVWGNMNYGVTVAPSTIYDVVYGRKGEIYVTGSFAQANASALAIDPLITVDGITYWDGQKFNKLAATGANNYVVDAAVAPNGYIYVTGFFTSIGGVAVNKVAYWDGSTWNAMGTGLGNNGRAIAIAPNGNVYVGGDFTTAGGQNCRRIAMWDGSSWHTLGALGGFNSYVYSIAITPDGNTVYIGGEFTDYYGLAANGVLRVAEYDVSTNTFSTIGSGFNASVRAITISPFGIVYCGGNFTASGATTINRIAQLQGSVWIALGDGVSGGGGYVFSVGVSLSGDVIVGGNFASADGFPVKSISLWNGSNWVNIDIQLYQSTTSNQFIQEVFVTPLGDIYVGGTNLDSAKVSGITYITNTGTAEVPPFVYILGQGTIRWLENQTTKKRIFMDLTVLAGEEVFIDFGRGTIESTVRGDLSYSVLPGSDFCAFTLAPGENKIAAMMVDDVGAIMKMGYTPTHWSADSTQNIEAL